MPIGKNAIKRVENNGYSKVKSSAPDMENSTEFPLAPKPMKKKSAAKPAASTKPAVRKSAAKPAVKKTVPASAVTVESETADVIETVASESVITNLSEKVAEKMLPERDGFAYVNLGGDLPIHLL